MTIHLNQLAHAVNTCTRIVPLRVVRITVLGEPYWLVFQAVRDCVKEIYPCHWFTSTTAVDEYCSRHDIDRQNVITQIEEE